MKGPSLTLLSKEENSVCGHLWPWGPDRATWGQLWSGQVTARPGDGPVCPGPVRRAAWGRALHGSGL